MELRWWPVVVGGAVLLAAVVAAAAWWPVPPADRRLRPLAHLDRLTRLPEYARLARRHAMSAIAAITLLAVLCGAAIVVGARPARAPQATGPTAGNPTDIMVCVADPVTGAATAELFADVAARTATFGAQRIGLTSPTRRVVPLTRDHQYAASRFADYAGAATLAGQRRAGRALTVAQAAALQRAVDSFAPPVTYLDYTPDVPDVLALCLAGFPPADTTRARMLIYLGDAALAPPGAGTRLFTADAVTRLARDRGVAVNVLTRPAATQAADAVLADLAAATGGRHFGDLGPPEQGSPRLAGHLADIMAHPPGAAGEAVRGRLPDAPSGALVAALVLVVALAASQVVWRR